MRPKISIITPSYQQGIFLEATIRSVLGQGITDLEFLVIDGGSKDQTQETLRRYAASLEWVSEPDQGQADAINKGLRRSHGEIIGWINADDLYSPNALPGVVDRFQKDPDLMMLYGAAHHVDSEGRLIEAYPTAEFDLERLAYHCFICQPACFFRRQLIDAAGLLDTSLRYALDLDLWIRFGKLQKQHSNWKFTYVPEVLAYSRMHRENKTLSKRRESYLEIARVVQKHFGKVPFNWIYGAEESASGKYDGYFLKSPMSTRLLLRTLLKWLWMNRAHPIYVIHFLASCVFSPAQSLNRLAHRTGERS